GVARCPAHGPVAPASRRAADLDAGCFEPGCPRHGCPERVVWAPVDESAPADPRNVYAATKLHQEHLCGLWGRAAGATVVALRYHNVYGPRMPRDTPYAGVASIFRSALAGRRPPPTRGGRRLAPGRRPPHRRLPPPGGGGPRLRGRDPLRGRHGRVRPSAATGRRRRPGMTLVGDGRPAGADRAPAPTEPERVT